MKKTRVRRVAMVMNSHFALLLAAPHALSKSSQKGRIENGQFDVV